MSDQPTQSTNGRPHLTYFDDGVSFVWSGILTDPIEVCPGGYGEPVQHRLLVVDIATMQTALHGGVAAVVRAFGDICAAWLDAN